MVIGGGAMGLAAAWRLAADGRDVTVLERSRLGHAEGSSHGATRIFRFAYDDALYVQMAQRSLELWRELDPNLVSITGGLDIGDEDFLLRCADALRSSGAVAERLEGDAAGERFPWLDARGEPVLFSPDTGVIAAAQALETLTDAARKAGSQILEQRVVLALHDEGDLVRIDTDQGPVTARIAIVTAGAWTGSIAASLDLPLRVTREQVLFYATDVALVPVIHRERTPMRYMVPPLAGAPGAKVGEHYAGIPTTADTRSFDLDPDGAERVRAYVREAFPTFSSDPVAFETCLYTNTPDEDFVIDRRGSIVVCSACSGHGFKFTPLIGDALARLATGRAPVFPLERFAISRFGPPMVAGRA